CTIPITRKTWTRATHLCAPYSCSIRTTSADVTLGESETGFCGCLELKVAVELLLLMGRKLELGEPVTEVMVFDQAAYLPGPRPLKKAFQIWMLRQCRVHLENERVLDGSCMFRPQNILSARSSTYEFTVEPKNTLQDLNQLDYVKYSLSKFASRAVRE
ncbi:ornithine aminotransferase, partial [Moniliophthora roreri]